MPVIPLWEGKQVAAVREGVEGVEETFDPAFLFRFWLVTKKAELDGVSRAGSLRGYILIRIALMVPMVWVLLTVVFLMMRVAPGDPISATLGGKLSPEELAERQAALGFDRPLLVQYFEYLWDAVRLQFGTTITDGQTIGSLIVENGGATLTLTVAALIFALIIGLPLGLIAGRYRETVPDAGIRIFAILGYAAPPFFVGLLAQLLFAKNLDWLPASKMASPIVQATAATHTHILIVDLAIEGDWAGVWDVMPAPDPARGDARPAGHGRVHPARAGQRRAGARRRLRRGRARPRHRRSSASSHATRSATRSCRW